MDQHTPELSLDESIKQVMQTLPPVIRTYLTEGKYTPVARTLMAKYSLRIDQGAVLERELMLLLMGVETPVEFTEALAEEARLDDAAIKGIVQDINDQIFVPLRKEEEKAGGVEEQRAKPAVVAPTKPAAPVAAPRPTVASAVVPPRPVVAPAPHIAPLPPKVVMPSHTSSLGDVVRSILPPAKPLEPSTLLEDHEEPHIDLPATPAAPIAKPVAPVAARVSAPEPLVPHPSNLAPASSPVNLPGAMPAVSVPVAPIARPVSPVEEVPAPLEVTPVIPPVMRPEPAFAAPVQPKPAAPVASTSITSYAKDPYREPIDEPLGEM